MPSVQVPPGATQGYESEEGAGVRRTWCEEQMLQQEGEFIGWDWGEGRSKPWGCKDVFILELDSPIINFCLQFSITSVAELPCLFSYGYSSVTMMETKSQRGCFIKRQRVKIILIYFHMNANKSSSSCLGVIS